MGKNRKNFQYGLLGEHLGHSYSPEIHSMLGCDNYSLVEKSEEELGAFLEECPYQGLNVTIPYKKKVIPFCKELSEEARETGSVNTLVKDEDGNFIGHNTDVYGFLQMVKKAGLSLEKAKVVIFGNGGVCPSVEYAALQLGASSVIVISRRGPVTYEMLEQHYDADILVNATPVGMYPNVEEQIVNLEPFTKCQGVLDLIYNPNRTRLLQQCEKLNLKYINGLTMLVEQAKKAEQLFGNDCDSKGMEKRIRQKTLNLVLVGMPGSGKSTIGKALSKITNRPVVDLDSYIEEQHNCSIPNIFETKGEKEFRKIEQQVLIEISQRKGIILVTGGGCVLSDRNKEWMKYNGWVCQIERDIPLLAREGRPLSRGSDLKTMYHMRKEHYNACADAVVWNKGTIEETAKQIWKEFMKHA